MKNIIDRFTKYHETTMHVFGVACPSLCALSLFDYAGLMGWVWLLFLWMACGHFLLFLNDVYPRLKYHAFTLGLFAFGVGVLWPLWLRQRPQNGAWGN